MHDQLNPKLFDADCVLYDDVRETLLSIVDAFVESLDIPIRVVDVQLVGSNAAYNYTDSSDVDLHVIYSLHGACGDVSALYYNSERQLWNTRIDATVHGLQVELYLDTLNTSIVSNGIYSVLQNIWLKFPDKLNVVSVELEPELTFITNAVLTTLYTGTLEDVQDLLDTLYLFRKNSLAISGEYGKWNLIFKHLRSLGFLDDLKDKELDLISQDLSL